MEKTNWIEKIKKAVRIAINKGLDITSNGCTGISIYHENYKSIQFDVYTDHIIIITPKGFISIKHLLTDREKLEMQTLFLCIKEYREDMAISEFEEFISNRKEDITDINNLDDDN